MSLDDKKLRLIYVRPDFHSERVEPRSAFKALGNGSYERYDLAKMQADLEAGAEIVIRQATRDELIALSRDAAKTGS